MKENLQALLSMLFLMSLSILFGILTLIYGWGLHPRSWLWIIGIGLFGQAVIHWLMDKLRKG